MRSLGFPTIPPISSISENEYEARGSISFVHVCKSYNAIEREHFRMICSKKEKTP